ncbi:MAG: gliding motility-associated C-terminal domain-containing protein, partial [Bacteroidota bacterium]
LNLEGLDQEADSIRLVGSGVGFDFTDLNIFFGDVSGFGMVSSRFFWKPLCSQIPEVENGRNSATYEFDFIIADYKECNVSDSDSIKLFLTLIYEATIADAPNINIEGAVFNSEENCFDATVEAGNTLSLNIIGEDEVKDLLNLRMNERGFDTDALGMTFSDASGLSPVNTSFVWETSCGLLNDTTDNTYLIDIIVNNIADCGIASADTVKLRVQLTEITREAVENFPNAFSPDNNGVNDFFEILQLPADLCSDNFEFIEVTNRWGDVVFFDERRDFRWDGVNHPEGVYYYNIKYTNTEYKGLINLIRITE